VSVALIELQYLPPVSYFTALSKFSEIVVEKHEHYEKQTYRNRCYINTSQGSETLIVPLTSKSGKVKITDVKIDYTQKWLNNHWRALQSAYGNAPFYEYFSEDLHAVLFKKIEHLYDLNYQLLTLCLKWMKWNLPIRESLAYEKSPVSVVDLRSVINPKKPEGMAQFYRPAVYYQVFGSKFVENLSLIDLIFCEGPGARVIIQASTPK
jgi:hypothetical protein